MAQSITSSVEAAEQHTVAETQLRAGAIGLPGILMIGVTTIAPAIAGMFTIPFIPSNASVTAPLAYLGAFVIALMLGYVLAQFSKYMTSAGTYYTYVSRSLGAATAYRGIEISTEIVIVLGVLETLIVLALALSGFADPGKGGVNCRW